MRQSDAVFCSACRGPCRKRWVIDAGHGYANDPYGARAALIRAHEPKTTPEERAASRLFVNGQSYPCAGCGLFAFPEAGARCFSCRRINPSAQPAAAAPVAVPKTRSMELLRALANKRSRRCAGYGCDATLPGSQLMCIEHLELLPQHLRDRIAREYSPSAAMAWPLALVEDAIRYTMTDGDLSSIVGLVERSNQKELFGYVGSA